MAGVAEDAQVCIRLPTIGSWGAVLSLSISERENGLLLTALGLLHGSSCLLLGFRANLDEL